MIILLMWISGGEHTWQIWSQRRLVGVGTGGGELGQLAFAMCEVE